MSTDSKLYGYITFRKNIEKLVSFVGLWPLENAGLLYRSLPYLSMTLFLNAVMIVLNSVGHHTNNIKIVTLSFGVVAVYLLCTLKVLCIVMNLKQMLWFHKTIDGLCDEFIEHNVLKKFVLDDITVFRFYFWFYTSLAGLSGTVPILMPLISIITKKIHHVYPVKYNLIIPGMYPWNSSVNELIYGVHYGLESCTLMCAFFIGSIVDVLFSFSVLQMTVPLVGMSHVILHLTDQNNYPSTLQKCLIQYRTLIKCRNIIEKTYGPIILGVAVTGPIALCSLAWQVTQMETIRNVQKIRFAIHAVAKTLQVFSYSWSATVLRAQSEKYLTNVYSSDWHGRKDLMSTVLVVLTQRPLTIQAGHMSDVSLVMFLFVMKTTVSYYLLLQTIEQKSS